MTAATHRPVRLRYFGLALTDMIAEAGKAPKARTPPGVRCPWALRKQAAVTGELGQPVHGRPEHLRGEHATARRVIGPGGLLIPDVLNPHGTNDVSG